MIQQGIAKLLRFPWGVFCAVTPVYCAALPTGQYVRNMGWKMLHLQHVARTEVDAHCTEAQTAPSTKTHITMTQTKLLTLLLDAEAAAEAAAGAGLTDGA